jgi:hypothetical protein
MALALVVIVRGKCASGEFRTKAAAGAMTLLQMAVGKWASLALSPGLKRQRPVHFGGDKSSG